MRSKNITFTDSAKRELDVLSGAINEILDLSLAAFISNDPSTALQVEPLEQIIDGLKEQLRTRHINRLQRGECSIDAGFVWSDLLTNIERASDHCSNIAGCIIEMSHNDMNMHESLRKFRDSSEDYKREFETYSEKYKLAKT